MSKCKTQCIGITTKASGLADKNRPLIYEAELVCVTDNTGASTIFLSTNAKAWTYDSTVFIVGKQYFMDITAI